MTKRFICQMIASFCAFASFTIATRHVWFDRCYPYALERALFESVIFRGAWTPVHLGWFPSIASSLGHWRPLRCHSRSCDLYFWKLSKVLHRKRNDLAKHIKYQKRAGIDSRLFKGFIGLEAMTGVVAPKLAIRRKTMPIAQGVNENNPQAPETKPMIFICTTLWHEEGNCHHKKLFIYRFNHHSIVI